MAAMSDFLENALVDHMFRTTNYTAPTILAVALWIGDPLETGAGGAEVTGAGYARKDLPPLNTNWNATQGGTTGVSSGTGGLTDNAVEILFGNPTANWGTITHYAIYDAITGGNQLFQGILTAAKTVNNGDPAPKFVAGDLDFTFN